MLVARERAAARVEISSQAGEYAPPSGSVFLEVKVSMSVTKKPIIRGAAAIPFCVCVFLMRKRLPTLPLLSDGLFSYKY